MAAQPGQLTWGLLLNGGIVAGALVAALAAREFHLHWPRKGGAYFRLLEGGLLMGYGAGLASGCAVSGFFSAVPSLGLNGLVFGLSILAGAILGLQIIKRVG